MPCSVCQHPKRQEIDQALVAGSATLNSLCREHGLSTSALSRHKGHLAVKLHQTGERLQDILQQGCLFWISQALEITQNIARAAEAEGNFKLSLQAVSQGTRLVRIIQKQNLSLDRVLLYDIMTSPQWLTQSSLLPHDPEIMSRSRQSLVNNFSSPCPDAEPGAVPLSPSELALLQKIYASQTANQAASGPPPAPPIPCVKPKQGKKKKQKGKAGFSGNGKEAGKSGKLPGNFDCFDDEDEEYRNLELAKKIALVDLDPLLQDLSLAEEEAVFEHLDECGPLPEGKPISAYLFEQGLLLNRRPAQGLSAPRS
jgi:hypothetical protein